MSNRLFRLGVSSLVAAGLLLARRLRTPKARRPGRRAPIIRPSSRNTRPRAEPTKPKRRSIGRRSRKSGVRAMQSAATTCRSLLDDYVLSQPPIYTGPPRPVDPRAPVTPPPERPEIPVVADFLKNAAEQFGFVPDRPASDIDFKRAYAKPRSQAD